MYVEKRLNENNCLYSARYVFDWFQLYPHQKMHTSARLWSIHVSDMSLKKLISVTCQSLLVYLLQRAWIIWNAVFTCSSVSMYEASVILIFHYIKWILTQICQVVLLLISDMYVVCISYKNAIKTGQIHILYCENVSFHSYKKYIRLFFQGFHIDSFSLLLKKKYCNNVLPWQYIEYTYRKWYSTFQSSCFIFH